MTIDLFSLFTIQMDFGENFTMSKINYLFSSTKTSFCTLPIHDSVMPLTTSYYRLPAVRIKAFYWNVFKNGVHCRRTLQSLVQWHGCVYQRRFTFSVQSFCETVTLKNYCIQRIVTIIRYTSYCKIHEYNNKCEDNESSKLLLCLKKCYIYTTNADLNTFKYTRNIARTVKTRETDDGTWRIPLMSRILTGISVYIFYFYIKEKYCKMICYKF